jgi:4-amino-4-deoxy-L-arabinose transferase-like glycosyltransferase
MPCAGIYSLALGLSLASFYVTRHPLSVDKLDQDEREYYDLAGRMLDGSYDFHPRRAPGAPAILACLRKATGDSVLGVQIGVIAFFSLSAPLTFLLVRRDSGSRRAAWLAGLGVATWPLFVRYGGTLYSEPLALPCLLLTLLAKPSPAESTTNPGRIWRWLLAGALLGVCILVRPMYLIFAPLLAGVVVLQEGAAWRGFAKVGLLAAGCLLVTVPWSVTVSIKSGIFTPISKNGGETLAGGLNPVLLSRDSGTYVAPDGRETWVGPGQWLPPAETGYLSADEAKLPYARQDELLWQRSKAWIVENPGKAAYISVRKLLYMWGIYPFWNGKSQTLLGNVPTLLLLGCGLSSLWVFRGRLRALFVYWTLPMFVSAVALISWGSWRFRQPGDLGLIVLTAVLLDYRAVQAFLDGSAKGE